MSLVADYSSSSEGELSENEESSEERKVESKWALPSADVLLSSGRSGEVFNNPYKEAEDAKLASLEKHVKMVNSTESVLKTGKKICWNYRKGRCRFGSNCSFTHDSDLVVPHGANQTESNETKNIPSISTIFKPKQGIQISSDQLQTSNKSKAKHQGKRPHPGLGDSIIPSKKVVRQYNQNKI